MCIGIFLALASCSVVVIGILEKFRFEPFYTPVKCSHGALALPMSKVSFPPGNPMGVPAGKEPYGLYGPVANLIQTCENSNEYDIATKKSDSVSRLYLPNLTNSIDGKPYLEIGQSYLNHDVTLRAKRTTTITSAVHGSAPFSAFGSIGMYASLRGYVPLYTKIETTGETCLTLLGFRMCGKAKQTTWCGTLGGSCMIGISGTNMSEPGICAFTRAVCRSTESDMKALTNAQNLGLKIVAIFPCPASTGLPPSMNCSVPAAAGLDKKMNMLPIPGYVDGPDPNKEDLDKAESAIILVTSAAISLGVALTLLSCSLAMCCFSRWKKARAAQLEDCGEGKPAVVPVQPATILTAGPTEGKMTVEV